jgi:arginine/serine-rich splicing factor 4/5/6
LKNGYAFIEFAEYRDADDAAHDLNGRELMGERCVMVVSILMHLSICSVSVELARGTPRGRDSHGWRPPTNYSRFSPREGDNGRGGRGGGRRPERSDYRLIVENLSSRIGWQVCVLLFF